MRGLEYSLKILHNETKAIWKPIITELNRDYPKSCRPFAGLLVQANRLVARTGDEKHDDRGDESAKFSNFLSSRQFLKISKKMDFSCGDFFIGRRVAGIQNLNYLFMASTARYAVHAADENVHVPITSSMISSSMAAKFCS